MTINEQEDHAPSTQRAADPLPIGTERAIVRLTFWQTALSVVGVVIAIIALYAAMTESRAVRQQTAASVWPYVQFQTLDTDTGQTAQFVLTLSNAGVGPAKLDSMRMAIDNEAVPPWQQAVATLGGSPDARVRRNYVSNRVLSPGETIEVIGTDNTELARLFSAAVADACATIAYCYCSIFEECWLIDSAQPGPGPQTVDACPDFGGETFKN